MTLGSLFDGMGAFPLAAALHGIRTTWASEVDDAAIRVTSARFPQMNHLGDIRDIDGGQIEPVGIIAGGSPCQDLSAAGKRAGLAGDRSGLFFEMTRIIREMREATAGLLPRWVIWENVTGALSSNGGADFETVIRELADIGGANIECARPARWQSAGTVLADGFGVSWRVLDAQHFGVPQQRRRLFVVADYGCPAGRPILFEPQGVRGNPPTDAEETSRGAGEPNSDIDHADPSRAIGNNVPWRLLRRAAEYGDVPPICLQLPEYQRAHIPPDETVYASTRGDFNAAYKRGRVGALTAGDDHDPPVVIYPAPDDESGDGAVHRLRPRQCLKLQGFPETWCDGTEPRLTDRDIYRLAGNSIALPCAEYVLWRVDEHARETMDWTKELIETWNHRRTWNDLGA